MPIFAKLAYAESVDLPSMLFLRFALAGLMMAVLMRVRGMVWPRGRNLLLLLAMGLGLSLWVGLRGQGDAVPVVQVTAPSPAKAACTWAISFGRSLALSAL